MFLQSTTPAISAFILVATSLSLSSLAPQAHTSSPNGPLYSGNGIVTIAPPDILVTASFSISPAFPVYGPPITSSPYSPSIPPDFSINL